MSGAQNWRQETEAGDYFGHRQKELNINSRRPVIRRSSDLVGPGVGAQATRLTNLNDRLAQFNGFFSAAEGAMNSPDSTQAVVGFVSSDDTLGGVQVFYGLETGARFRRVFLRKSLAPESIIWQAWVTE